MSKVWFVTGAGRGIGMEITKAALAAGDRVVATGRNIEQLEAAYAAFGERVLCVALDTAVEADSERAVATAVARFGRIDVLVNNAGYGQLGSFEEVTAAEVEQQFQTNVFGLMHVSRAVLPHMRRQRSGHLINVGSVAGFMGFDGASVYCASKFAVEGFSASIAPEVAPFGIKVTVVEPGFFRTDFLDARSVRYGSREVAGDTAGAPRARSTYERHNHQQPGDPVKLGPVVVQLAALAEPPLRFIAGTDGLGFIADTMAQRQAEVAQFRTLSASTDGNF